MTTRHTAASDTRTDAELLLAEAHLLVLGRARTQHLEQTLVRVNRFALLVYLRVRNARHVQHLRVTIHVLPHL